MKPASLGPIVIIDDDKSICRTLKLHFERIGYEVTTFHNGKEGVETLDRIPSAIVILDLMLPDANGVELLKEIKTKGDKFFTIMITAFPDMESTVMAVKNGVGEYIYKPIDIHELDKAVAKGSDILFSQESEDIQLVKVPDIVSSKQQFISKSLMMKELFKTIGMVSMSRTTVNVTGESGTGKELIARAIHNSSAKSDEPFISINCSAIVDTLLESELFGHEKGSFTGAINRKEGKFALARNGTIFLDEIGEMDINIQAKLLRVLQEKEFEMVGGKETIKTNCRVISATNKDLGKMVEEGKFREDLYYRLKVISLHLPPLRDRREDIPALILYFIGKNNLEMGKEINYITQDAIDFLVSQTWTGNVRQIENMVTSAVIMTSVDKLTKDCFISLMKQESKGPETQETTQRQYVSVDSGSDDYSPRSLDDVEKEQISLALDHTKWHKGKACDILGLTRPRLERKINKYNLQRYKSAYMSDVAAPAY